MKKHYKLVIWIFVGVLPFILWKIAGYFPVCLGGSDAPAIRYHGFFRELDATVSGCAVSPLRTWILWLALAIFVLWVVATAIYYVRKLYKYLTKKKTIK